MGINSHRNDKDYAKLYSSSWSGMLIGTDGYPIVKNSGYHIAGGDQEPYFKAKAIEFYGLKSQA
jgi:hypothetical protein